MNNRTYNTILIEDLDKIDFTQIKETSAETIRNLLMKLNLQLNGKHNQAF